jgi:hypothetical protein
VPDTLIERMAIAAATEWGLDWAKLCEDSGNTGEPDRYTYRSMARASLAAMREPTEAMVNAGFQELPAYDIEPADAALAFTAMIDTAIADGAWQVRQDGDLCFVWKPQDYEYAKDERGEALKFYSAAAAEEWIMREAGDI